MTILQLSYDTPMIQRMLPVVTTTQGIFASLPASSAKVRDMIEPCLCRGGGQRGKDALGCSDYG